MKTGRCRRWVLPEEDVSMRDRALGKGWPTVGLRVLLISLSLFLVILVSPCSQGAAQEQPAFDPWKVLADLDKTEQRLRGPEVTVRDAQKAQETVNTFLAQANECIEFASKESGRIDQSLAALGPEIKGEDRAIARERESLLTSRAVLEGQMAQCRLLALKANEVSRAINSMQRNLFARRLLHRYPDLLDLIGQSPIHFPEWLRAGREVLLRQSGLERLSNLQLGLLAGLAALGTGFGFWVRRALLRIARSIKASVGLSTLAQTFFFSAARHAPLAAALVFLLCLVIPASAGLDPRPWGPYALGSLLLYLVLRVLTGTFLRRPSGDEGVAGEFQPAARPMARRLNVLASLICIAAFVLVAPLEQSLPPPFFRLIHGVMVVSLCASVMALLWYVRRFPDVPRILRTLTPAVALALFFAVAAELAGYGNLAVHVLRGLIGTMGLGLVLWAVDVLLRELFDGLAHGRHPWQKRVRHAVGIEEGAFVSSFVWMRFIAAVVTWVGFTAVFLMLWGAPSAFFRLIFSSLIDGFQIGQFRLVPGKVLLALAIFSMLWTLATWFKGRLEDTWLVRAQVAPGSREMLGTVTGYAGFALAILLGLSVAGVDFSGLAIVAGALSVGIGFGLQNIVNNFVSGLILLFERPIKRGDWIVVGQTEGYVKKISVRSTVIQTFDRADVIVPNSELISSQVINWMLEDPGGRLKVPVGVAYGSDTALVKRLLLDIAYAHPDVIKDGTVPEPRVMFLTFGESSLDFALWCFLKQADSRFRVLSEINFAIDAAFREHGIQIPFPQRDLHIKEYPSTALSPGTGGAEARPGN